MQNDSGDEGLDTYSIELPQTWPDMISLWWLGMVPNELGALIFTATGICIVTMGWLWGIWGPFAWYFFGWYISRDYHAITKFNRWLQTSARTSFKDTIRHGGYSTSPAPMKSNRPKGMPTDAL